MSNTPSKAEIEALVKRHGATSYRNRADTQHPAYGFTEDGLNGLIDEVLAKWGTPAVAGKPVAWLNPWRADLVTTDYDAYGEHGIPLYTTPQPAPAPAPLSEREAFEAWIKKEGGDLGTFGALPNMHYRNSAVNNAWVAWKARAALAAQGGK